jgi:hypothetical protein
LIHQKQKDDPKHPFWHGFIHCVSFGKAIVGIYPPFFFAMLLPTT